MNDVPSSTIPLSPVAWHQGLLHGQDRSGGTVIAAPGRAGVEVAWARHLDEVREAQRLRYDVFAKEMGARLKSPIAEHDIDIFDDFCEHLLVRDSQY